MARLIDADELIRMYFDDEDGNKTFEFVPAEFIDNAPTIEAEPIKHGRWIVKTYEHKYENGYWTENRTECSVCGNRPLHDEYEQRVESDYCPNCGARMDAQIGEDKSHPFAESVMMGMDEAEE